MDLENEQGIDTEALQAQIDLSMSFAQDMVSSWIKPHNLPKSSRRNDLELELKEYMKKPPRLGVGAPIPTTNQSLTRETARLKGRLAGPKRNREDEEGTSVKRKSPSNDDNDGESRAGAIQKKQRVDPFAGTHGKKKKKQKDTGSVTPQVIQQAASTSYQPNQQSEPKTLQTTSIPSSPKSLKRAKTPEVTSNDAQLPSAKNSDPTPRTNDKMKAVDVPSSTVSMPSSPPTKATSDASHPPSPSKQVKLLPPALLKKPLLNLSGPPPDSDSDEAADATPTSPKKKRKRRKKKKNLTGSSDAQASAAAST